MINYGNVKQQFRLPLEEKFSEGAFIEGIKEHLKREFLLRIQQKTEYENDIMRNRRKNKKP